MSTALEQLVQSGVGETVTAESFDQFVARDRAILLITGDPVQRPEASDVVVVARELCRDLPGLAVGVVEPALEARAKAQFSVSVVPTVVFLRDGVVVASLSRLQEWSVYRETARQAFTVGEVGS